MNHRLLLLASLALTLLASCAKKEEPYFGKELWPTKAAYDFQLTDQDGRPLTLDQFRGKVVLFAFGFTHCPSYCPATLTHFSAIRKALPEALRDRVQFLFISLDPARDTPASLKQFVSFYDPSFLAATGTESNLQMAITAYYGSFRKVAPDISDPDNYLIDHTTQANLINPAGRWELYYSFEKLSNAQAIAKDIERILKQNP
jgi:protein SCO1/2